MANLHYCKLAEDCNWCNVKHCPYEKLNDPYAEMEILYEDDDDDDEDDA